MKNKRLALLFAVMVTVMAESSVCMAQTLESFTPPANLIEDFKPASTNQPGQEYPQVNSQGCVRFKIIAPQAKIVTVNLPSGRSKMTFVLFKDEDGSWMRTTGVLGEGFFYYNLEMDEGTFNDPGSLNFYGNNRWENGIELPAKDQDFYALKDVPHGFVQQILFPYKSSSSSRRALVYTPPGYQTNNTRYPVLYLQHRPGENETVLNNQGRVNLMMDNLIASGNITPFIVVMTYGTSDQADFISVLADELVPYVDANFRTLANPANRAIAGMSNGLTSSITSNTHELICPDVFASQGLFGGGVYDPTHIKYKRDVKLLFMCNNNLFDKGIKQATTALKEAGINAVSYFYGENESSLQTWRRGVYQFAQVLFK